LAVAEKRFEKADKLPIPRLPALDNPHEILDSLEGPLKLLEGLDSAIKRVDGVLKGFNSVFSSLDGKLLSRPSAPIPASPLVGEQRHVPSPSYPGQSPTDYCLECLSRHHLKALGLLEEAERFSLGKGEITPEARQRIELAVKEIVTAEEDLGTRAEDPEIARMLDEIKREQRELRKWMWAERLLTTQRDINRLREAIERMKRLVDLTHRAASYYHEKYGKCSYCESLAKEIAAKFNVSEGEVLDALYGLASDNKERVNEAAEKLRRVGAFEYALKRVKDMLEELRGGGGGKVEEGKA
jgi:hypothetical protein